MVCCNFVLFVPLGRWRVWDGRHSLSLQRFSIEKREVQCLQAHSAARGSSAEVGHRGLDLRMSASHSVDE